MEKASPKLAIVCHLFYPAIAKQLLRQLEVFLAYDAAFFFNIQGNQSDHIALRNEAAEKFRGAYILSTPNKGRDIGAKFMLIDLLLLGNSQADYTLIIHDKNSPHLENSKSWREDLFKIIDSKKIRKVFNAFERNARVGIIGTENYIQNEYNEAKDIFLCNSNRQIKELLKRYAIETMDYDFVAGNIFWIRTSLLRQFFSTRSILQIRAELEMGNALDFDKGTYIHSWERIMSWIATSQGYTIYGI